MKKPEDLILDDLPVQSILTNDAKIFKKRFVKNIPDTTKLIIAQRVSSLQDADRIIVMDNGRISAIELMALLQNNEIYRDVYESQASGTGDF